MTNICSLCHVISEADITDVAYSGWSPKILFFARDNRRDVGHKKAKSDLNIFSDKKNKGNKKNNTDWQQQSLKLQ